MFNGAWKTANTLKFTILFVQVARGAVEATEVLFNPTYSSLGTTISIKISRYFVGIRINSKFLSRYGDLAFGLSAGSSLLAESGCISLLACRLQQRVIG